jgi:cytochrome P450
MHNSRYFSNPESFVPERWIESEREKETCVKNAWIAFHYGKWSCIGKPYSSSIKSYNNVSLAMMEMRVTLARLIWKFDLELKDIGQKEPEFHHKTLSAGSLMIRVKKLQD